MSGSVGTKLGALALARRAGLVAALALTAAFTSGSPAAATFSGENGPILFREDRLEGFGQPLFRANPDGSQVTQINSRPGLFADWRADGKRIAFDFFQRDGDEQIATMNPDGSEVRVITHGRGIHEVPSWSPSGRRIVFDVGKDPSDPDFETRLWTMRANGSHARRLPMESRGFDGEPRYSPDGRRIAFMRLRFTDDGEQQQAVFVVGTRGKHRVKRLTPWRLNSEHPTWAPDGRWILFNNAPDGTIQVMRPNGSDRHTILTASAGFGGHKPWFSLDSSLILFMCENQGTLPEPPADYSQDICIANADGSNVVKVIDTPETFENWPSWGPAAE
jgi:Tol biopolymer transport system component